MILYSIMPEELIYPQNEEGYQKQKIVDINGVSLLVNEEIPGEHYVVRVMSSNPNDYLNSEYTPGQRITLSVN
ncbi:YlzJ-like family protein [Litchfieldia alkalitelluris]|uniref:YlzJ-like family protein n=1 Tax=Litchfieldia alkalitelluris TaxID=304268 RepID=UPI000997DC9B|nr:YlzJ-like family protein [Litchfieldia alkalitelluris]